ncbi:MAG: sulfurtransferase TusA family protein [Sphingomonadales bacterium]|nr:sulfurtransferase TusA family protein [Sphingomonadales bacterium]
MTTLDLSGLKCPLPVLKTAKALRGMAKGAELTVIASDPMAEIDMAHFCAEAGHHLLSVKRDGETLVFRIRRGEGRPAASAKGAD